ncbi:hypothetical protein EIN_273950 [Entamoeba invadens IP1]|uniref:Uncharacterized protein n=1 Tax=Entamoeba invadens IP1 TaxID=370355 RepID=A0A0A1U4M9_ENTIV|nr:hypothetical protein EIN_273950 [Entamoeba invadens IP1]ELP87838.1 hypothetical protein EIN_273950 [Entamoeba invadens IP1]|eukprot:XP_004254609.1 hypothetical protein EIN_273950 [Entamoeba invadens IP1]
MLLVLVLFTVVFGQPDQPKDDPQEVLIPPKAVGALKKLIINLESYIKVLTDLSNKYVEKFQVFSVNLWKTVDEMKESEEEMLELLKEFDTKGKVEKAKLMKWIELIEKAYNLQKTEKGYGCYMFHLKTNINNVQTSKDLTMRERVFFQNALYLKVTLLEMKVKYLVLFAKLLKVQKTPEFFRAHNKFADFLTTLKVVMEEGHESSTEKKYLLPKSQDVPKVEQPPTKKAPRKSLAEMIAEQRFMMTEKGKDIKLPLLPPLRPKTPKPTEEQALAQGAKPKVQQQKQEEEKQHQKVELKPTTHQERKALIKQQRERGRYVQQATATKPTPGTPQTPHVAEQTLIRPIPQILQPPHFITPVAKPIITSKIVKERFTIPPYKHKPTPQVHSEPTSTQTGSAIQGTPIQHPEQPTVQQQGAQPTEHSSQSPTTTPVQETHPQQPKEPQHKQEQKRS